jgi:outer membrane immunogenic protein
MKKLCAGLLGLALAGAPLQTANAADWYHGFEGSGGYKEAPYLGAAWTGFYAGVNAGYGWSAESSQLACDVTCSVATGGGAFGGVSPSGGFAGVQLGYNWQGVGWSPLVLGVEADIQAPSVIGKAHDVAGDAFTSRLQMFGTARGRIGYAYDRALVYFTGGFAYGTVYNEANIQSAVAAPDFVTNPNATGYVLGGGLEYKFWRDLSVKVEYQYVNLGKNDPVASGFIPLGYAANGGALRDDAFNTVRVGLNWWPFGTHMPLK